jgi:hypothetical protein
MSAEDLNPELRRALGTAQDLAFLAALDAAAQHRLGADIDAARERQRQLLDQAIEHGLRMVPALLRGPLKRILFP